MSRRRPRRRIEEEQNRDRWLMSYADFITLLFGFFVVMYAISSVNEGKYRVLSDSIIQAFNTDSRNLPAEMRKRDPSRLDASQLPAGSLIRPIDVAPLQDSLPQTAWQMEMLTHVQTRIEQGLTELAVSDIVSVERERDRVAVEINSELLFDIGSSRLLPEAERILQKIGDVLKSRPYYIEVEGFTDNLPINTPVFPSNWELSAARAASVVHLFTRQGVPPRRMVAIGYGEHRPRADNRTRAGRRANRRVVLVITTSDRDSKTATSVEDLVLPEK